MSISATAVTEGLLAELDYQNIPNFRNLGANFRDLTNDPENRYSIMIQWGTTGIIARSDRLVQPVTSWADLWNPAYAGKVGIWPYPREVIGITLKSLGYSVNSEDPEELRAAADKLARLRKNVYLLDPSSPTGAASLLDSKSVMFFGWSFDAMEAQEQVGQCRLCAAARRHRALVGQRNGDLRTAHISKRQSSSSTSCCDPRSEHS